MVRVHLLNLAWQGPLLPKDRWEHPKGSCCKYQAFRRTGIATGCRIMLLLRNECSSPEAGLPRGSQAVKAPVCPAQSLILYSANTLYEMPT